MAQWPLEEFFTQIDRGGATGGKPFFLGDMRSQCRPQCAHCACSGPVASGKKFYTEVYSMDRGQIGPGWGGALAVQFPFFFFGSCHPQCLRGALAVQFPFFFFGSCHPHTFPLGLMAQWPDGVWKKTPCHFFFLVPWAMSLPVCANEKKQKILKKRCKKKVLLNRYYREKIPLFFF